MIGMVFIPIAVSFRYTDSVMNYQSMGPSASSFAQFYHQAAASAVSAASAGVVGGVGDSLGIKHNSFILNECEWFKIADFFFLIRNFLIYFFLYWFWYRKLHSTIIRRCFNSWKHTSTFGPTAIPMDGVNRW